MILKNDSVETEQFHEQKYMDYGKNLKICIGTKYFMFYQQKEK